MRWSALVEYTRQVRALLDGVVVQIDGGACQMMHVDDLAQRSYTWEDHCMPPPTAGTF
jgi:hypothetical protein